MNQHHKTSLLELFTNLMPPAEDDSMRDVLLQLSLLKLLGPGYEELNNIDLLTTLVEREYPLYEKQDADAFERWDDAANTMEEGLETPPFVVPAPDETLFFATGMLAVLRQQHYSYLAFMVYRQQRQINTMQEMLDVVGKIGYQHKTESERYKALYEETTMDLEVERLKTQLSNQAGYQPYKSERPPTGLLQRIRIFGKRLISQSNSWKRLP